MATVKVTTTGGGDQGQGFEQGQVEGDTRQGLPVGGVLGAILVNLFGSKPRQPFNPFGVATKVLKNEQEQAQIDARIQEDIRLDRPSSSADIQRKAVLVDQLDRLQRKFEKQQQRRPGRFTLAGFPEGVTFDQLISIFRQSFAGQKVIGQVQQLLQFPAFNPPLLPSPQGGSTVPFVVTPSSGGGSGFGGFLDSVIGGAGRIVDRFLAPQQQVDPRFQQAAFPLVPAGIGAIGRALLPSLPAIGAGAVGGELADAFQNLFTSGGASSVSDRAAFTDAVPGRCRAKQHIKVNPCTGAETWFVPRGKAVLFSGDLATCKRVARVNKRVQKAMPPKHHHHRKAAKR